MKIGYHVTRKESLPDDLSHHAARIKSIIRDAVPTMQIFAAGPKSTKPINVTDDEMKKIRSRSDYVVVIHGSYLDRPFDTTLSPRHPPIAVEVKMAKKMNAIGPIVHLSRLSRRNGDSHIPQWLPLVFEVDATRDVPTIDAIISEIDRLHFPIVIDTAHVYASGINIHDPVIMAELLNRLPSSVIGIHLNDTPSACGSGIDRHEKIGNGNIFSGHAGRKSLKTLITWAISRDVWMIIETPMGDDEHEAELKLIKDVLDDEMMR